MREFDRDEGIDGRAIANLILDNFDSERFSITNLKINKLIFFAHGIYSARFSDKLVRNHIEAWENGPVIHVVFSSFKENGRERISNRARYFDYQKNRLVLADYSSLDIEKRNFILRVVEHYVHYTASALVSLTHEAGTPWHRAFHQMGNDARIRNRIPEEWIKDFFVENFGNSKSN